MNNFNSSTHSSICFSFILLLHGRNHRISRWEKKRNLARNWKVELSIRFCCRRCSDVLLVFIQLVFLLIANHFNFRKLSVTSSYILVVVYMPFPCQFQGAPPKGIKENVSSHLEVAKCNRQGNSNTRVLKSWISFNSKIFIRLYDALFYSQRVYLPAICNLYKKHTFRKLFMKKKLGCKGILKNWKSPVESYPEMFLPGYL